MEMEKKDQPKTGRGFRSFCSRRYLSPSSSPAVSCSRGRSSCSVRRRNLAQTVAMGPHVLVTQISGGSTSRTIELPASIHGYIETPVYAKVAGYMKSINVDKGDHVKAGEVIALIESPETDKQVADARSFYWIQKITDVRYQDLVQKQVVPQQTADQTHSAMLQAKASYEQQLAFQGYEVVRSSFDGIVTARYADPGTLIPQATTPHRRRPAFQSSRWPRCRRSGSMRTSRKPSRRLSTTAIPQR